MDIYPPAVQRPELLALVSALDCTDKALRRDECGDWRILGRSGHVYAVPEGFQILVEAGTPRAWSAVKRRLAFADLRNDGDTEGCFILDRLPTAGEAALIRRDLTIRKRPTFTPEHLQALRERQFRGSLAA